MGSLMPGWDSPAMKSNLARYGRSSSFTKGEIEEFWNKQRLAEHAHFEAAVRLTEEIQQSHEETTKVEDNKDINSSGESLSNSSRSVEEELDSSMSFKDWWTKSNWAFLNEPAIKRMESADKNYSAQFNVAKVADIHTEEH
ncbi:hypothetical protein KP509_16G047100 [Ceratopteris richardii]|uniref:Uncharacterized protein n=1 Tax=Ceratopteris richardii TaxID=49495 RepID=A0A8T2T481_CERRI|nr:hypothetical protein KP509_16G047100 [Ceratopteris richardii]